MNYLERFRRTQLLQKQLDTLSKTRKGDKSADAERIRNELAALRAEAQIAGEAAHKSLMASVANGSFVLPTPEPYSQEAATPSPLTSFDDLSSIVLLEDRVQRVIVESSPKGRLHRLADYPFVRELVAGILGSLITLLIQNL